MNVHNIPHTSLWNGELSFCLFLVWKYALPCIFWKSFVISFSFSDSKTYNISQQYNQIYEQRSTSMAKTMGFMHSWPLFRCDFGILQWMCVQIRPLFLRGCLRKFHFHCLICYQMEKQNFKTKNQAMVAVIYKLVNDKLVISFYLCDNCKTSFLIVSNIQ